MSTTPFVYLSQFTNICDATPEEALAIISSDIWFEKNKSNPDVNRYIKFKITNTKIIFVSCVDIIPKDIISNKVGEYIQIDKNIKIENLEITTPITYEELASIVFSVNQNLKQFKILKKFFRNLQNTDKFSFEQIKYNSKMKSFCAHLAYLIANTTDTQSIPDWMMEDSLISEEIKMFESIHMSKFRYHNIPSFDNCEKLFVSSLYLSFMIVYDKAKDMQSQKPYLPPNITELLKCLVIDLNKANSVLKLIN